ncbi:MAG: hypothetical protein ABIJ97_13170, partial [Bacteroidota bacterium]
NNQFSSVYLYKMHASILNNGFIFNLLSLNIEESRLYTFYKYENLGNGLIKIFYLSGKNLKSKFNNSKELYKFLKNNPDSLDLSFKEFAFIRKIPVEKNKL